VKYNCNNQYETNQARTKLDWLIEHKKLIEIKEIRAKRSLNQNSYLHLLISFFALEYGEMAGYIKMEFFKKICNEQIFKTEYKNPKTGEVRTDWRSSASLDSKEMTTAIDRFRDYASKEAGIYLPQPDDKEFLFHCEKSIEMHKQYI